MKKVTLDGLVKDLYETISQLAYTRENMMYDDSRDRNEFNAGVIGGQIESLNKVRNDIRTLRENLKDII